MRSLNLREFETEFKAAEQLEQTVKTTQLETKQIEAADSENHAATPTQQS